MKPGPLSRRRLPLIGLAFLILAACATTRPQEPSPLARQADGSVIWQQEYFEKTSRFLERRHVVGHRQCVRVGDGVDGTVATVERDAGTVQVSYDGLPLYTFANDSSGESTCYGSCAETWPPLVPGVLRRTSTIDNRRRRPRR